MFWAEPYVVESVFSYPGIGALSYESARYHDYNLLMILMHDIRYPCNFLQHVKPDHK